MQFHEVSLELVRPGPTHNQLLSPLTQYLALCGESAPITFTVGFEHAQLLSRLQHLRYFVESADGEMIRVGASIRESQLAELGESMGRLLGEIRSLGTEISTVRANNWSQDDEVQARTVHLRLVISGSELAILPFELSIAPQAVPGEGAELFLQGRVPVVPTREIRRSRPLSTRLSTFDHVKVLFAYAAPGGSTVPFTEHLHAIRAALDPWVGQTAAEAATEARGDEAAAASIAARKARVKEWIRVLPNASLESIAHYCSQERFSHVHILAHGDTYTDAGQTRYGVALCDQADPVTKNVVSGKRLAHALGVESKDRNSCSAPFWVTLATCDSANAGSVIVPGGSIAHDLHSAGIPWVLASQFPLTKRGSVKITRILYERLFGGDDPRRALHETRKQLYTHSSTDHDWASLVTYASIPPDFDLEVIKVFEEAAKSAIDRLMDSHDASYEHGAGAATPGLDEEFARVEEFFDRWKNRLPPNPEGSMRARIARTKFYGITGSVKKRRALHIAKSGRDPANLAKAKGVLAEAWEAYREATQISTQDGNLLNWVASQYLSLSAVLNLQFSDKMFNILRNAASNTIDTGDAAEAAWAHGSEAEAELLAYIMQTRENRSKKPPAATVKRMEGHMKAIIQLMGADSFHVKSTKRQFARYADDFEGMADFSTAVQSLASDMVELLGGNH